MKKQTKHKKLIEKNKHRSSKVKGKNEIIVYMDESGNTGVQKYDESKTWNFNKQNPQHYFYYGAIITKRGNVNTIVKKVSEIIRTKFVDIKGEFKWSNKKAQKRANKLVPLILDIIIENRAIFYVDIENKKFSISKYI
ncbi:MAG: DUF3800 domain-containing protein, partial [Oscillospiraceae bacterium]|nr:DUF3800 domain-containing protein [Oscillospiraceae bacterium]